MLLAAVPDEAAISIGWGCRREGARVDLTAVVVMDLVCQAGRIMRAPVAACRGIELSGRERSVDATGGAASACALGERD